MKKKGEHRNGTRRSRFNKQIRKERRHNQEEHRTKKKGHSQKERAEKGEAKLGTQNERTKASDSQKRKSGRIADHNSKRLGAIKQLRVGDSTPVQVPTQKESKEVKHWQYTTNEKKFRRAALRLFGGIHSNKNGWLASQANHWWNEVIKERTNEKPNEN